MIADLLLSILNKYHEEHNLRLVPIKVDMLKPMIEERGFVDRIIWEEFDFPSEHVLAQVQFFKQQMGVYAGEGDYARIQISNTLNFCWRRFVLCKEMYHCLLDVAPDSRVSNTGDLMTLSEHLVSESSFVIPGFEPHTTEQQAEVLALETLCPLELREHHIEQYEQSEITSHQIALRYRIPENFVQIAMYPSYLEAIHEIRQDKLIQL